MKRVTVIGGGVVGLSSGLSLQRLGHAVTIVDKLPPGDRGACSFGNAGILANYEVISLNSPKLPMQLPGLLSVNDGPVSVLMNRHFLKKTIPWGLSFLSNCTSGGSEATQRALASLNKHSKQAWDDVLRELSPGLTSDTRVIHATNAAGWEGLLAAAARRRAVVGAEYETFSTPKEITAVEPTVGVNPMVRGMVRYGNSCHFRNPGRTMQELAQLFEAAGGTFARGTVANLTPIGTGLRADLAEGDPIESESVVVSGGSESIELVRRCLPRDRVQCEPERGYHIMFTGIDAREVCGHAVGWLPGKFFITPMETGVRVAGLSEWGGRDEPADPNRLDWLERKARLLLPKLPPRDKSRDWLGYRASIPDQTPVISRSVTSPAVFLAFGHGHLGMTQGPLTGKLVSQLVSGQDTLIDLHPFRASRF